MTSEYCCMGGKHDWAGGHCFDAAWGSCFGWTLGYCAPASAAGGFRTAAIAAAARAIAWRKCTR